MILFLYEKDFLIIGANRTDRAEFLIDIFQDYDREDENRIHDMFFKFAAAEGIVTTIDDGSIVIDPGDNAAAWRWKIATMNFKSLVNGNACDRFIDSLINSNDDALNKIINFHHRLGVLFDHKLLNTLVNRLYQSVDLLPYPNDSEEPQKKWLELHLLYPWLWICIMTQVIVRTEFPKTTGG